MTGRFDQILRLAQAVHMIGTFETGHPKRRIWLCGGMCWYGNHRVPGSVVSRQAGNSGAVVPQFAYERQCRRVSVEINSQFTFSVQIAMTTSYSQIIKQIETLQRQAESARSKEVAGVVSRIKEAIAFYRLSAADLGLSGASGRVASVAKTGKSTREPKFADGSGNTWGGRGPRPAWLSQALASGKSLSDFALGASGTAASKPAGRKKAASKGRKVAPKYRDENGNTWAGRGLQPRWFKEALAQGKTPESMLI